MPDVVVEDCLCLGCADCIERQTVVPAVCDIAPLEIPSVLLQHLQSDDCVVDVVVCLHAPDILPPGEGAVERLVVQLSAEEVIQLPFAAFDEQFLNPFAWPALHGLSQGASDGASAPCAVEAFQQFAVGEFHLKRPRPIWAQCTNLLQFVWLLVWPVLPHRK